MCDWSSDVCSSDLLLFDHFLFALIHGPDIPGSYAILLFTASELASITGNIYNWVFFALAPSLHSFWSYFSTDLQQHIGHLPTWGVLLSVSYHFAFSCYSLGSQGKNTEVVFHSLLQWTTFCQTSPPWPIRLGWPQMAWLSFIELGKAVVRVIRLTSFLWLWFQCVCPLMPSHNTYRLTWVSLTLDMGYLCTAAPAKHSCCSLPWMSCPSLPWTWSSSSWPLLHLWSLDVLE